MPRSSETIKNYTRIGCEVTRDYAKELEELCKNVGMRKSEFFRLAVKHYAHHLEEENKKLIEMNKEINERIGI